MGLPIKIAILTIFPEMFDAFRENGMIGRAVAAGRVSVETVDIRDFTTDRHRTVDDRPYGGGCGMVMKPEPLAGAIRAVKTGMPSARTLLLSPRGRPFNQAFAEELSREAGLVLVCGRYEGIDERIGEKFVDDEVSIGDYVLTGGELPAMVLSDAVVRLIPGVLGGEESAQKDSFSDRLLEHGHYTRPREFEGSGVPEVLLSGDHGAIDAWRLESSLMRTLLKRPDLMAGRSLGEAEVGILEKWRRSITELLDASPRGADRR